MFGNYLITSAVVFGAAAALHNLLIGVVEYRNRKLSDGRVGALYTPESLEHDNRLGCLGVAKDLILFVPGEYIGEVVYRRRHRETGSVTPPPPEPQ